MFYQQLASHASLLESGLVAAEYFVEISVLEVETEAFLLSLILAIILLFLLFEQIRTEVNISDKLPQRAVVSFNKRQNLVFFRGIIGISFGV